MAEDAERETETLSRADGRRALSVRETAAQFGVMAVPTLIFFKAGVPADQIVGSVSRQVLEQTIQRVIA